MRQGPFGPSRVGVVLLGPQWRPLGFNAEAARILGYPGQPHKIPSLDAILPATRRQLGSTSGPALTDRFTSGRREYVCRTFLLDSAGKRDSRLRPRFVVILERVRAPHGDLARWSEQYQLTTRERETVEHLAEGLSSKEIASKMNISPRTVKSFLRLVMVKVGASNRGVIIAKMHEGTGDDLASCPLAPMSDPPAPRIDQGAATGRSRVPEPAKISAASSGSSRPRPISRRA
jgi:DNA-binding CsgD family transcriptional regulator